MTRLRAIALTLAATGCGGSAPGPAPAPTLSLEISSSVGALDQLLVTALEPGGAVLVDSPITLSGKPLPGTVKVDTGGRTGAIELLVWGVRGKQRVGYGSLRVPELEVTADTVHPVAIGEPPSDLDADGIPDARDGCPIRADPRQEDADADGVTDVCTTERGCPGNLLINSGFDQSASGWVVANGTTSLVAGRHASALHACRTTSGPFGGGGPLSITRFNVATGQSAGASYWIHAWGRSDMNGPTLLPVLRETDDSLGARGQTSGTALVLDAGWKRIELTYVVKGPSSSSLHLELSAPGAAQGSCLDLEDICLVRLR
jgi:hypothetical protein